MTHEESGIAHKWEGHRMLPIYVCCLHINGRETTTATTFLLNNFGIEKLFDAPCDPSMFTRCPKYFVLI